MRVTAALLTVLCAILCQQAQADDPPAPSQAAAPTTAVPASAEANATPPAAEKGAAPGAQRSATLQAASPVITPGVTVVGTKQDLTPDEKELINRGYKLEMRHGERYFCRREQQLGSRFEVKSCNTAPSIQAQRLDSQEAVRTIQNDRPMVNH
jgi:hypothetical protein